VLILELWNSPSHLVETKLLLVPFFKDRIPLKDSAGWIDWLLCGQLSQAIIQGGLTGARGDKVVLIGYGKFKAEKIMAYGFGEAEGMAPDAAADIFSEVVGVVHDMGLGGFAASAWLWDTPPHDYHRSARLLIDGLYEGLASASPPIRDEFKAGLIEESQDEMKVLEDVAREVRDQFKSRLVSEVVLCE
jgi:hypothetical protein